jgi:hypothetical protein
MKRPCNECPFLKDGEGKNPVRLVPERVEEVWESTRHNGPSFPCHKTVSFDDDGHRRRSSNEALCMGAVLAGVKSGEGPHQLGRIHLRISRFTDEQLSELLPLVFESEEEMMETALDWPSSKKKKTRRKS